MSREYLSQKGRIELTVSFLKTKCVGDCLVAALGLSCGLKALWLWRAFSRVHRLSDLSSQA